MTNVPRASPAAPTILLTAGGSPLPMAGAAHAVFRPARE